MAHYLAKEIALLEKIITEKKGEVWMLEIALRLMNEEQKKKLGRNVGPLGGYRILADGTLDDGAREAVGG